MQGFNTMDGRRVPSVDNSAGELWSPGSGLEGAPAELPTNLLTLWPQSITFMLYTCYLPDPPAVSL